MSAFLVKKRQDRDEDETSKQKQDKDEENQDEDKDEENQKEEELVKVNQRKSLLKTIKDEETKPEAGILKTNLHPEEIKPTKVIGKTSVRELTRIFSKPSPETTVPPPPLTVKLREKVPTKTNTTVSGNNGRLPSKKNTGHTDISRREGSKSTLAEETRTGGLGLGGE